MTVIPIHIDLRMKPLPCCRDHALSNGLPTFLIVEDATTEAEGGLSLSAKVVTHNIGSSLEDIRQLGNALEVLGHALIEQSEPLFLAARKEKSDD